MDEEQIRALVERAVIEAVQKLVQSGWIQAPALRTRLSDRELEQRRAAASASLDARRKKAAALQKRRATLAAKSEHSVVTETIDKSDTSERPVERGNGEGPSHASRCWLRYASAFKLRHGAFPPRNAKANGILAQLVARLGAQEAPDVAEFYVRHDDQFYVKATHPLTLLLRDAEKLRTQWATGGRPNGSTPGAPWWETWPGILAQGKELNVPDDENPTKYKFSVLRAAAAWGSLPREAAEQLGLRPHEPGG
jgi:hypothetical protein